MLGKKYFSRTGTNKNNRRCTKAKAIHCQQMITIRNVKGNPSGRRKVTRGRNINLPNKKLQNNNYVDKYV